MDPITEMEREKAGREAAESVRLRFLEGMEERKMVERTLLRLNQALNAKHQKAKWVQVTVTEDENGNPVPSDGGWTYSRKLVDHGTRLKAVQVVAQIAGLNAAEKHDVLMHGELDEAAKVVDQRFKKRTGEQPGETDGEHGQGD